MLLYDSVKTIFLVNLLDWILYLEISGEEACLCKTDLHERFRDKVVTRHGIYEEELGVGAGCKLTTEFE